MAGDCIKTEEIMRRVVLKALEEAGIPASDSMSLVAAKDLIATLVSYWSHEREDVARQSIFAQQAGRKMTGEIVGNDPGAAAELAYGFGVEVGKLLAKLEYPASPEKADELVEWRHRQDLNRKNSDVYKEGLEEVKSEAIGYANAYLHLFDHGDEMRMSELCEVVFQHLMKKYPPADSRYRYIPPGKQPEEEIRRWIKGKVPNYVSKPGRRPK